MRLSITGRPPDLWDKMRAVMSSTSAWLVVVVAGVLEIVFSVTMKLSESYTRLWPSVASLSAAVLSSWLLSLTLKVLPVGTAYAVWAGIGVAGTAVIGILAYQEPATAARLTCIALVLVGIVGLQMQGAG
jgi:quaternary ammonium compound-resistance protein SugE